MVLTVSLPAYSMKLFWGHSQDVPLRINQFSLWLWEQLFQSLQRTDREALHWRKKKNHFLLFFLFTFMPVKELFKSSFTSQKNFPQIWHTRVQNVSALFHTLGEVVLHMPLLYKDSYTCSLSVVYLNNKNVPCTPRLPQSHLT